MVPSRRVLRSDLGCIRAHEISHQQLAVLAAAPDRARSSSRAAVPELPGIEGEVLPDPVGHEDRDRSAAAGRGQVAEQDLHLLRADQGAADVRSRGDPRAG